MHYHNLKNPTLSKKQFVLHSILPIFIGSLIYIIFRSKSLIIFKIIDFFHLTNLINYFRNIFFPLKKFLPDFFIYSFPDGLWAYSMIFTFGSNGKLNNSIIFSLIFPLFLSFGSEVLQYFSVLPGTFCFVDIFSYTFFITLASINLRRFSYE